MDAKKARIGPAEALALARQAEHVVAARGKKVVELNMKKDAPDDETLLAVLLGPTGNLRRRGDGRQDARGRVQPRDVPEVLRVGRRQRRPPGRGPGAGGPPAHRGYRHRCSVTPTCRHMSSERARRALRRTPVQMCLPNGTSSALISTQYALRQLLLQRRHRLLRRRRLRRSPSGWSRGGRGCPRRSAAGRRRCRAPGWRTWARRRGTTAARPGRRAARRRTPSTVRRAIAWICLGLRLVERAGADQRVDLVGGRAWPPRPACGRRRTAGGRRAASSRRRCGSR